MAIQFSFQGVEKCLCLVDAYWITSPPRADNERIIDLAASKPICFARSIRLLLMVKFMKRPSTG
jgi:hypothetical protein